MAWQVCRSNPGEKGRYIKFILALLQSTSTAVVYECAVTLVSLSQVRQLRSAQCSAGRLASGPALHLVCFLAHAVILACVRLSPISSCVWLQEGAG